MQSKKIFWNFTLFFITILSVLFSNSARATAQAEAQLTIISIQGNALIRPGLSASWNRAAVGMVITEGSTIKTEKDTSMQLEMTGVGIFSLYEETQLDVIKTKIHKQIIDAELHLKLGILKGKIGKLKKGSSFHIRTPTSVAAVRGTEFLIAVVVNIAGTLETLYFMADGNLSVESLFDGTITPITKEQAQSFGATSGVSEVPADSEVYSQLESVFEDLKVEEITVFELPTEDAPGEPTDPAGLEEIEELEEFNEAFDEPSVVSVSQ